MAEYEQDELIERAKRKEEGAYEELFYKYYHYVYNLAAKITHSDSDAKDVAQETFIQVYNSISSLKNNRYFKLWLNRIIVSKSSNLFRHNKDKAYPEDHFLFMNINEDRNEHLPHDYINNESSKEMMIEYIDRLDPEFRSVVILAYYCDMGMKDIADFMQIPIGTVKSRLSRSKKLLYKMIINGEDRPEFRAIPCYITLIWYLKSQYKKMIPVLGNKASTAILLSSIFIFGISSYNLIQSIQTSYGFQPLTFKGEMYDNEQDAYFAIQRYAHCKEKYNELNNKERSQITSLYAILKQADGSFHERLLSERFHDYKK